MKTQAGEKKVKSRSFAIACVAVLAILMLFLFLSKPAFFQLENIKRILIQASSTGIMTFGLTLVLITGGIDISMPMMLLLSSVCGALVMQKTGSVFLGILAIFLIALLCGSINGLAVARFRMMPFMVTLVMQGVAEGAATLICYSATYTVPERFIRVGNGVLFGFLPVPVLYLLVLGVFFHLLLNHTAYGRYIFGTGINAEAVSTCGINTGLIKFSCYAIAGLTTGIGALITTARLGSASLMMVSDSTSLDIVCAAVIGGASIYGGVGSIAGAFVGALIITIIQNLINLFGLNTFTMYIIKGIIILLCTYYDLVKTKIWGKAQ